MIRSRYLIILFLILTACAGVITGQVAEGSPPLAEKFLHEGRFTQGESALRRVLDRNPTDDEARFGLGVIQILGAVENLGQSLYHYGAVSRSATTPFLRLPVPKNESPAAISYPALGKVLDTFATELGQAEVTLAGVRDEQVKLRLRLAPITFDFEGTGNNPTTLVDVITKMQRSPPRFLETNPDFRIHFDYGDVQWLRAYCHLLSAMVDVYRSLDLQAGFDKRVKRVFPNVVENPQRRDSTRTRDFAISDPAHLRQFRLHVLAVCELNAKTWAAIRAETDNDHEWLSHPRQTDPFDRPLSRPMVAYWLAMLEQVEALLKGEAVLVDSRRSTDEDPAPNMGFNLKRLLEDPPATFTGKILDVRYLEAPEGRERVDLASTFVPLFYMLGEGQGIFFALRMN